MNSLPKMNMRSAVFVLVCHVFALQYHSWFPFSVLVIAGNLRLFRAINLFLAQSIRSS